LGPSAAGGAPSITAGDGTARLLQAAGGGWRLTPWWERQIERFLVDGAGGEAANELRSCLPLLERLGSAADDDGPRSALVEKAVALWMRPGFETLLSPPRLRFDPFPYQLRAAEAALRRMRGRAILADEVGLGKTIEAGLVLSELYLRRLAQRVLILVPAGLVEQWVEELDRKFALPVCVAAGGDRPEVLAQAQILLASLPTARRGALRDGLTQQSWDLVVVDEAHRLKNPTSASARLARALTTRYLLLLTATPVENRLEDIFQLVNLVRPGHLGTPAEFRARHGSGRAGAEVRAVDELRAKLRTVMVRHRRSQVSVMLPPRLAETIAISPDEEEASLYAEIGARVRERARAEPRATMGLEGLLRLAGSNPGGLASRLERFGWDDLAARAAALPPSRKIEAALVLLRRQVHAGEKVVLFTAFRETLDSLARLAAGAGLEPAVYHGALSRRGKEEAVAAFRGPRSLLITTEAAGEGRNLQFSRALVNYDLPWNPMQIEQRLGRLHRIGQDREVLLWNLVTRGTLEERILHVLEAKLNLFELVVGELDMVLGRVDDDFDFESSVFQAHVESADGDELTARLDSLGERLSRARRDYLASRERTDNLVAELE
jgi:SNF2 family DNA or RNA helicase